MNYAVILAGGVGERFWPVSTPGRPKQLLRLISEKTMLRETVDRLDGVVDPSACLVLTNASLVDAVRGECAPIPPEAVIGEPRGRNTAPAIGLACGLLEARDPEAVVIALPADHAVRNGERFATSVLEAFQLAAENDVIVLFGVVPDRPETGYGYIERGDLFGPGAGDAYEVAAFREKPDSETARKFADDGRHYWNSGLFCARARVFLDEYTNHLPQMRRAIDVAVAAWEKAPSEAIERFYASVESTSVDYGVMQKTDRAVVLPVADWGWDDVGSWEALSRWVPASDSGNAVVGDVVLEACDDVIAFADQGRIAALGVSDCVIVRTADATLVVHRDRLDELKPFVRTASERPLS